MSQLGRQPNGSESEQGQAEVQTGAESVVEALRTSGVEVIFGVQGGAIMPVYDALYDADEIHHVTMGHEQGAAHAADAYGVVSGQPGVCLATSGPGATNLVTGLADANMDSDAVLALTGQAPSALLGKDAFQEVDTVGVTLPITKYNSVVTEPESVGQEVMKAFSLAESGRHGPTLVDLPKDITQAETESSPLEFRGSGTAPDLDERVLEAAAATVADAGRPLILAGGGVIKGNASNTLRKFATEHDIPVVTTMPGVGCFPEDHELALGFAGMHGTGSANMAVTVTDCLLAIGTRFDDRLTGGVETFAPDAEVIHVDIDPSEFHKNILADYPLLGDAGNVLDQLSNSLPSSPDTREWMTQCRTWKATYPLNYKVRDEGPVKPQFIVEYVDTVTDDDTIVTTGVGQHQMWACQYWTYTQPRTWISSHGLGTMGYGLPAAIGARLAADDDQTVVCFDGDGSFLMSIQELAVAVREHLDVTVFILNNAAIGMVRQWQDAFYDERRMASEYPWVPAFDVLAESFGARGFRIDSIDDVEPVVKDALSYDGPSIVDAHVDPEEDVYPMVPSGGDNGLFALSPDHL